MLKQSRASETLSHGVTRQRRSLSPVYNAVTSPTLYKAEAEEDGTFSTPIVANPLYTYSWWLSHIYYPSLPINHLKSETTIIFQL